jgi:2-iminobutanoate/2-iminopropanoate deaminase
MSRQFLSALLATAVLGSGVSGMQESPAYRPAVVAAGYVYVSTTRPKDLSESSTIASQTTDVFAQLKAILEANGSSMAQLCSVNVSVKSASDFAQMNEAYRAVFTPANPAPAAPAAPASPAPPARTTIVAWMQGNAKIEITATALPNGAHRETMQPAKWGKNPRPYSYIVKTDDLVFFSGLISRRGVDDAPVVGGVRVQMNTILDNAATLLETADLTFDDIVAARVYLTSPYDFEEMNQVYGDTFAKDPPARATAVVELMSSDASVEVTFIASRQPKKILGGVVEGIPVSAAVQAGPRVWLSGVIGDTDKHPRDSGAQMRDVFARMQNTLDLAGLKYSDVVDTTVYLRDWSDWPKIDAVYREVFPHDPPARNSTAARLVVEPGMVEALLTAIKR